MKKFSRIFFAVAALFAFACTTDTTEDLGVELKGQTTLTLSLEESRTQLGTAVAGLYPVTWSEDDAISVNGVKSSAISISENQSVATFTFNEVLAYPYTIAYPAAAEGKVLFADQQAHTEGTFAEGAAAMYGYKTAEGGLALNHLTGVLKIGVTGDKTLSFAQISTVDRAPIAGEFALNFETGEVTPTTASKEVISYSFGEGLALASEAQHVLATVPAGEYDELYVTLYDTEGGVMYVTVRANDAKPLAAGKVREFSNAIVYVPNAEAFVIRDVATLKSFAEQAATLEKNALVVADIDMTGEAWIPIEGYAKTLLGNGYAIKGLTAPLFGTTNASIKGLHLEDVVLNSNDSPIMGALACKVVATDAGIPVIEHCSVSGTLTVNNTTYVPTGENTDIEMNYAGIVAQSQGAHIKSCESNVAITVNQVAVEGNTAKLRPYVGGIVGNAYGATLTEGITFTEVIDCVNNGDILYKDVCCKADNLVITPTVGGIAGGVQHYTTVTKDDCVTHTQFTNCKNYGAVTIQANGGGANSDTQGSEQTHVAGIVARGAYTSLIDCDNHGDITLDGTFLQTYSGGVCGASWYSNLEDCDNFGAVTVTEDTIFRGIMLAGVSGNNYSASDYTYYSKNCTNNAPISCLGSVDPNAPAGGLYHYRIGGCEGFGRSIITDMVNNKEGVVTCKGNIIYLTSKSLYCEVGGVTAYRTTHPQTASCNYADVNVDINFTVHADVVDNTQAVTDRSFFVAGVTAYSSQSCKNSINKGNVTVSGSYAGKTLCVAGITGYGTFNNAENYGKITLDENTVATNTRTYIGGIVGGNDGTSVRINNINRGDISVKGSYTTLVVGGISAQNRLPLTDSENYGNIDIKAYASGNMTAAGIDTYHVRQYYKSSSSSIVMEGGNGPLTDCTNHGNITIEALDSGSTAHVGGVCRQGQNDMIRCVNNGDIEIKGSIGNTLYVGGVVTTNSACLREDCVNNGDINVSATSGNASNTGADVFIGGLCYSGGSNTTYRRCINNGNITFTGSAANCARFAGIIANVETAAKTNIIEECENHGDIVMNGTSSARSAGTARFGGLFSQFTNGTVKVIGGFKNTGDITFSGNQNSTTGISIGGIIGGSDGSATPVWSECTGNIINEGKLSYTGTSQGGVYIGGIIAFTTKGVLPTSPVKFINTGDIEFSGTTPSTASYLAGFSGSTVNALDNVQVFCNIYAPKFNGSTAGIITRLGRTADTVQFTNAKVGGTICTSTTTTKAEDADGTEIEIVTDNIVTLDATNYFNYIYGTNPDWTTIENYDGCTVITSKDQIDYTVNTPTVEETTPEA